MNAPGRNDPCPCGSGKKYKRCCLDRQTTAAVPDQVAVISQAIQLALEHHYAGRFQEEAAIYRQMLQMQPESADALHLLGLVAHRSGQPENALDLISKAIEMVPDSPLYYFNVAAVLIDLGLEEQALACYQRTLELQPGHVEALGHVGHLLLRQGRFEEAAVQYRAALAKNPRDADACFNLGNVYREQGRFADALASYRKALQYKPSFPEAHNNIGFVLAELGHYEEAESSYRRALNLRSDYAEACCNLGSIEHCLGKLDEAVASYHQALSIRPDYVEAHYNLGCVLSDLGRRSEALECYQKTVALAPGHAAAYNNLAMLYRDFGKLKETIHYSEKALSCKPDLAEPYINIGNALTSSGRLVEAAQAFRDALKLNPGHGGAYSNLLFSMLYDSNIKPGDLYAESIRFAEHFEAPYAGNWPKHGNSPELGKRLRLGYVSADFRNHAVAYFIESILANHDRSEFEVYCYYNHPEQDWITERLRKLADHWIQTNSLSDEQMAARIQADGIDILVDLSGHTAGNRLPVFARKPAPVQVTWMGYCGTTGLNAMDYRLTDVHLDPPGLTEQFHTETLVRLPASAIFQPAAEAPAVGRLPAHSGNGFTFACLNNPSKLNEHVIALWSRILKAVPGSRMMLGNADASQEKWLLDLFVKHGVEPARIVLQQRLHMAEYLALHNQIDLALDPFPYTGGTTTLHALWMGVPVLTLAGNTTVSRVGAAIMGNFGLPQFVASDEEEYLERAIYLASDLAGLEEIRQGLRERIATNPASNPVAYTRALEEVYRDMWHKWCQQQEGK